MLHAQFDIRYWLIQINKKCNILHPIPILTNYTLLLSDVLLRKADIYTSGFGKRGFKMGRKIRGICDIR